MRFERITVEPDKMGGVPCIRGLRIPVATVVAMLAEGMTAEDILAAYPISKRATSRMRRSTAPAQPGPAPTLEPVSTVEQPRDPRLHVYPPEEALKSRSPTPLPGGPRDLRRSR